ncbi:MAG: hypothetical protein ABFS34_00580 [Gemmatimonadota bacterium]
MKRNTRPATDRVAPAIVAALFLAAGCADEDAPRRPRLAPGVSAQALAERVERFAPADIDADTDRLAPWEKVVLERLIRASDAMHEIFLRQVSERNAELHQGLALSTEPWAEDAVAYLDIMAGPWDRLDGNQPFLDVGARPAGAGFYPADLSSGELDEWLAQHPEDREAFTGYFSVLRREHGTLISIPYSVEYRAELERAAALLLEAAEAAEDASLAAYLELRAAAFRSDDYYASDVAWMDIGGTRIEPTIGPYEVYEDGLRGAKAAFESFIALADSAASAELDGLKGRMRFLEGRLPVADRYKDLDRSFESPIRVVDLIYAGGDARAGVQTIAFNLPNDERVRSEKGSKKVMLRNVSRAKFELILTPIAELVLGPVMASAIEFDPWFTAVLLHELAHGLGPGVVAGGSGVPVHQALREHHSALEEAKADAVGLHSLGVLAEEGLYQAAFVRGAYRAHLADLFRSVRFGVEEAHGQAAAIQFAWAWERGAILFDEEVGAFALDLPAYVEANRALAAEILRIQAEGDLAAAAALRADYGAAPEAMRDFLPRLAGVPVDIRPEYVVLDRMAGWGLGR